MVCAACGGSMNGGAKFCSNCGCAVGSQTTGSQAGGGQPDGWQPFAGVGRNLVRPLNDRMIAGVCSGLALYFGWDVLTLRWVAALAVLFGVGTPVIAYIIGWAVMPNAPFVPIQGYAPASGGTSQDYSQGQGPTAS